ncbi:outer membrane protein transport protein [uncultured Rhodoblastus sp.]|uniref:OmpP1/FadL family transporter n=1 Tax=uncultured Rhodoblastus sp. TaxID=543037 RepID=UPI0025DC497C|nr:outer membrane protein transport protein [uncultured Rhodoblastus sp.]
MPTKMKNPLRIGLRAGLGALVIGAAMTGGAGATEGYFLEGSGAREQGLAGAGSANSQDGFTTANNPAGLVEVGHQINGDLSLFNPTRQYSASGTGLVAPGTVKSGRDIFVIPALGYAVPLSGDSALGVAVTGNGGMNTTYYGNVRCAIGAPGVFCGGKAGVDLNQALITVGYAQRFGALSLGIAPVLGVQVFSAYGLGAFGQFGLSSNPAWLSDHSPSYSVGGGLRAGAQYHISEQLTVAVAGSTPIWSSPFENYRGLFAGGGNFDVPGEIGAGVAYKITPVFTVMADYKHIFYSGVKSVANQSSPLLPGSLGSANGPGFGWRDVDVAALGLEWRALEFLTLRAGYAYNTQPITAANVTFNILAPGVVTNHISGGFTYAVNHNSAIDFALIYSPRIGVSGPEVTPFGRTPGSNIDISMSQLQVTLGYTYHFDAPKTVIAKY